MGGEQIVGLHDRYRHAVQLKLVSASPAEALFSATSRWVEAVRRLRLHSWTLQRAEVLTAEEFDRDCAAPAHGAGTGPKAAIHHEGDDLLRSAFHDSLTGLPALALFQVRAQGIVSSTALSGRRLALVVLDVDSFGAINRELGYSYGDQVLVALAGRLADVADSTLCLARLAGDEFVLLVDDTAGAAESLATTLLGAIRAPLRVKGRSIVLTASAGLAPVTFNSDLDERLGRAGMAMCAAKEAGGDCFQWYESGRSADRARLDFLAHVVPERLAYVMLLERAALAANECSSIEEASVVVLHHVLAHTGWRFGRLWLVDETQRVAPSGVSQVGGPTWAPGRDATTGPEPPPSGGLPAAAVRSGKPEWTALVAGEESWADEALRQGLTAALAFPVLAGAEVVAVLEFFSATPVSPAESFLDVMAAVGAQLGRNLERTRSVVALARSEERYRILADSLPALIWTSGTDAGCTFVNRGWLEFTGRSLQEELDCGWTEGVHRDDVDHCYRTYRAAFDRREAFELEYRLRRADGIYRWHLSRGRPMYEDGRFTGYLGSCIDVTDRHEAASERHDEETRFRALVGNTDIMIVVLGADGTVLNEYLPVASGFQWGKPQGRFGFGYLHPEDQERAAAAFAEVRAHRGPGRPMECRVRHSDGSWRWLRAVPNNMLNHPVVQGIVYTLTDITEYKDLTEKRQVLREYSHSPKD